MVKNRAVRAKETLHDVLSISSILHQLKETAVLVVMPPAAYAIAVVNNSYFICCRAVSTAKVAAPTIHYLN